MYGYREHYGYFKERLQAFVGRKSWTEDVDGCLRGFSCGGERIYPSSMLDFFLD